MNSDNPAGRPADDFDPGDPQLANDNDDDFDDVNEVGDYDDDVYEDESADTEFYEDDEYDDEEFDDEEYEDEELDDEEFDDEELEDDAPKKKKKRRRMRLHCFNCHRPEGFYTANKGRWFHSYFLGLTFGLGSFVGPFKCQCCGHNRLMKYDFLNPRIWVKKNTVETQQL